ncbi:MAG: L-seryl-tRNA(Sec) selenium transferase [Veillonellales bacterium]
MKKEAKQLLENLPSVDVLLKSPAMVCLEESFSRNLVKQSIQSVLASIRKELLSGIRATLPTEQTLETLVQARLEQRKEFHLKRVVNAAGTIIHTNLGRSILSSSLQKQLLDIACHYSNLEYNLDEGKRGSRYSHLSEILRELTGAEDVLVVNNNAAAVLLVLDTLVKGREVLISRGELVEIGGFFRIPEVIERSGGTICEVGTTNKTHLEDYSCAINEKTGAVMKVHTSNYRIIGFTESVATEELAVLAHERGIPFINDLGSGLLVDMRCFGLPYEPTVKEALDQGCDVVTFSGDKLLGGPQAGIIVGKKCFIEQMKQNQLLRALRVDKMTLAALEATLHLYRDEKIAVKKIPVLAMLSLTEEECRRKAETLAEMLRQCQLPLAIDIAAETDVVGGGSYPEYTLPGYVVSVESNTMTAADIEKRLHQGKIPVIVRVRKDQVCLDVRTIRCEEFSMVVQAIRDVFKN